MPVKQYGIYLAYPPNVDLQAEGLGRHLAMFLKGAEKLADIRFTIVCPSWTRATLDVLLESEQVSPDVVKIITPEGKPYALRLYEVIKAHRARRRRRGWLTRIADGVGRFRKRLWDRLPERAVIVHDLPTLTFFLLESISLLILLTAIALLAIPWLVVDLTLQTLQRMMRRLRLQQLRRALSTKIASVLATPHKDSWVLRLFEQMYKQEIARMQEKILTLSDIRAWYCPTAFWPSFHEIKAPRLMCVPDVVLSEFPIGFARIEGDRALSAFEAVERAIRLGEHFVTYSEYVKWNTLVDRYATPATNILVVPHAPSTLKQYVEISGLPEVEQATRFYCQTLLRGAMRRSSNPDYTATFLNDDVKFLFYASQFRPSKNVLTLLRAFEHLLRKRYLGYKLILTGQPGRMPEIEEFVIEHRLDNDVIFLRRLSVSELAACYKLAELAVNPTLSEGGCPFTFAEALSVGTPVVMSRIPVAEEILTDPRLRETTFFDPFDWRDCANRIEWAVNHRIELLNIQQEAYTRLSQRTWSDVVAEHIHVLDKIGQRFSTDPN